MPGNLAVIGQQLPERCLIELQELAVYQRCGRGGTGCRGKHGKFSKGLVGTLGQDRPITVIDPDLSLDDNVERVALVTLLKDRLALAESTFFEDGCDIRQHLIRRAREELLRL